jgi:hypothetical protein
MCTFANRRCTRILQVTCSMHPEDIREYHYINSGLHEPVYDYSSSGLHRLYCAYVMHPDALSRHSTSRRSVALALMMSPVTASRGATTRHSDCAGSTAPMPRVWVPQHVARLVVDYFAYATRPGASARRAARHVARRRLLRLCRASGCLDSSRGSSRRSSSTTSPPPHVRVPRHVAPLVTRLVTPLVVDYSASRRLVVDYFAYALHPGASARRAARHAARRTARHRLLRLAQARRRLLCLRRASGCLGTSRGSSRGSSRRLSSSAVSRIRVPRHVARLITPTDELFC